MNQDWQTDMVNIKFFNSSSKGPGIIAKLKTSNNQNSTKYHINRHR